MFIDFVFVFCFTLIHLYRPVLTGFQPVTTLEYYDLFINLQIIYLYSSFSCVKLKAWGPNMARQVIQLQSTSSSVGQRSTSGHLSQLLLLKKK